MSETPIAIEELLAEREWLRRLAGRLVADSGAADDLVQETWVTALGRPPRHRRGLRGWLATVLRSRAHDARRRERRADEGAQRAARAAPPDDPAEIVARAELEQLVARLTLELSEPYRSTLLMRFYRGLSPKEIAERLGEPRGTIRSRLKRGLDLLRARLDRDRDGDRRAWVLALLPLAHAPAETSKGTPMLTLPMKITLLVVAVAAGASFVTGLLAEQAEPPSPPPLEVADDAPPGLPGGAAESTEPPAPAAAPGKEDPLDRKADVDFDEATLREALDFISDRSGITIVLDAAYRPHPDEAKVTLKADDIKLRSLLDLITLTKGLTWERRKDGGIVLRPKVDRRPVSERPARSGLARSRALFRAPEPPAATVAPVITPPEADMAEPLSAEFLGNAVEVRVASDGGLFLGEKPLPGEYALWLALLDRPDAPVLVVADEAAPLAVVTRAWRLAGRRDVRLATGHRTALRAPHGSPPAGALRVSVYFEPGDRPDLYEKLWRLRAGNEGSAVEVLLLHAPGLRFRAFVGLLNETARFGYLLRLKEGRGEVGVELPSGTKLAKGPVPKKRPGVPLGRRPEPIEIPRRVVSGLFGGRPGHRNLKAEGGGLSTERGLDRGLEWLGARQGRDGSWSGNVEETALSILAFLAAGETPERGRHRGGVASGLLWLEGTEEPSGTAAMALAEAYALTGNRRWRDAAETAAGRARSGLARRIARLCRVPTTVPSPGVRGTGPADCFVRILDGETPWTSEPLGEAMDSFLTPVRDDSTSLLRADDEFLHDASLAAFQAGGEAWRDWVRAMVPALVDTQVPSGPDAGSWDPPPGGSRVRTTALRVATLTVFYRYARLFRR